MTPQELEQLVVLAGDASKSQNQWEATNMLTQWLEKSDETVVPNLIKLLKSTQQESATFFALTTLQRTDMNYEQRVELRTLLMSLVYPLPKHLQIKAGVVLAKLIQQDFVSSWHSAFDELLQTCPPVYLRTLDVLFEASYEGEDSSTRSMKDVLRGMSLSSSVKGVQIPIEQTISAQIMQHLITLLTENKDSDSNTLALSVIKKMVCWIDLSLIMNERVISFLFRALQLGVDAAVLAIGCFSELVGRGMDVPKKVILLQEAKILENVAANVNLKVLDASPIKIVIEVATFVNSTGLELIEAWEENQLAEAFWYQVLDLLFLCFSYGDIDVSGAVIPFANRIAVGMEKKKNNFSRTLLSQMILVMYQQMKYPSDFQFDYEDDVESEEEMYRTELRKLNQRLVRADPESYLEFIGEVLSNLPHPVSMSPTPDVEVALRLVYHYCEGVRPSPGLKVVMKNSTFRTILCALHRSDITSHTHREVLLLYYDVAVRYAVLFLEEKELLTHLLVPLSGDRGLQHENHRVRSRSCYLLLKLVKGLSKIMKEYVETAVTGIHNLISNPTNLPIGSDDALYLFETIGILLGKTGLNEQQQQQSLTMVMAPHVQKIEKLLSTTDSDVSLDPISYGNALSESVAAIAYLSKGFQSPPESVQIVLAEIFNISLAVLRRLPSHDLVRKNGAIVWQRMALCLKSKVLPLTPEFLKLEIENCTQEDFIDAAQIMNQCCMKFKQNASPALDEALLPFLKKSHGLIPTGGNGETLPQLKAEQLSIKKHIFNVLYQIVANGAADLLVSPQNSGSLKDIFQIMSEGAISTEVPTTTKTCISFFRLLLEQWDQKINLVNSMEGEFLCHLYEVLIPGILENISKPCFDVKDAMQARILHEFAQLLLSVKNTRGVDEFNQAVLRTTFHSRGCPVNILEGYQAAMEAKQMRLCLEETLSTLKA